MNLTELSDVELKEILGTYIVDGVRALASGDKAERAANKQRAKAVTNELLLRGYEVVL
jgi:hypothetical protein